MVFSSSLFLFFFLPAFLISYFLSPEKFKNWTILLFSLFFYSWGAPAFVFMVTGVIIFDFYLINAMDKATSQKSKLFLLSVSLAISIGLLAYFKYANFFIENFNYLLSQFNITSINWTKIALPIGISFFTFQKITYAIDVYRKVHAPLKKLRDYLVYILLFPQMIAGPIIRFNEIADQLSDRKANETIDNKLHGFFRFIIGLSKKVLLANTLGVEVDKIFALDETLLTQPLAWIGVIAYSFQIYFDFSGYSDMAIGIGRMIGFKFPENFNNPYISQSITEFWRRWHITLSTWMRDYLYIPLGGNRVKTKYRLYINLSIVFLISGFWHGAQWNFIIWGGFHGLFLILDRIFLLKLLKRIGKYPSILLTYLIVLIGWVIFRAENMEMVLLFFKKMFLFNAGTQNYGFDNKFLFILAISALFSFLTAGKFGEHIQKYFYYSNYKRSEYIGMSLLLMLILVLSIASITSSGFNPFIYFRF